MISICTKPTEFTLARLRDAAADELILKIGAVVRNWTEKKTTNRGTEVEQSGFRWRLVGRMLQVRRTANGPIHKSGTIGKVVGFDNGMPVVCTLAKLGNSGEAHSV